jgi:hypothetical protein
MRHSNIIALRKDLLKDFNLANIAYGGMDTGTEASELVDEFPGDLAAGSGPREDQ